MDEGLARRFPGYEPRPITIGRSGDPVWRLDKAGCPALIVKSAVPARVGHLSDERTRMLWLARQGVPVPEIVDSFAGEDGGLVLVMACLPGADFATASAPPALKAARLGEALAALHALDPAECPFDETAPVRLARMRAHLEAKIAPERRAAIRRAVRARAEAAAPVEAGADDPSLFADIARRAPVAEDIVVAHGDPCLPNLMLDGERFSGFLDCGRVGRADRWLDLELAAGSIRYNLGETWLKPFFAAYGVEDVEAARMAWHRQMEERL